MRDAILFANPWSTFVEVLSQRPGMIDEDGNLSGLTATPPQLRGDAGMIYLRATVEDVAGLAGLPGVMILAQAETSATSADAVYASLFADPEAVALYDQAYDRSRLTADLGDGALISHTPPPRFGQMA